MKRLNFLDGLRGWGAVFVLLYHVFSEGLPVDPVFGERLKYLVPFNGTLAVLVFFAVSGFSLSVGYLADGDIRSWSKIAAGRYLRLVIPIFAACLIVHVAMVLGLISPPDQILPSFRRILNFEASVSHFLKFSLFDVFFNFQLADTYIGPLWTMSIELFGSFIVLVAALLVRPLPYRSVLLVGLAVLILFLVPGYATLALFPIGAAMADWFNRGWIDAIPKWVAVILLLAGCAVPLFPFSVLTWGLIGTTALVLGCIALPQVRTFLSGNLSAELGRISFPLYLMHGPVMCIVGEPLTRLIGISMPIRFGIDALVIVVSVGAAYAFVPVNNFAIWASRQVGNVTVRLAYYRKRTAWR